MRSAEHATSARKVLLMETHDFHGHVIYSQCLMLLDAGYEVTLLISPGNRDLGTLKRVWGDQIRFVEFTCGINMRCLFDRWRTIRRESYEFVLVNTLPIAKRHLLLMYAQPYSLRYIIHDTGQPQSRFHRVLEFLFARKISRVFVLSEKVYDHARTTLPRRLTGKLAHFNVGFFPDFSDVQVENFNPDNRVIFIVPGRVLLARRNYDVLVGAFERIADSPLRDRVRFDVMGHAFGDDGERLILAALDHGFLESVVRLQRDPFEPFEVYFEKVRQAHFILPLIDHTVQIKYNRTIAPSALMLSRGTGLPLVSSTEFDMDTDLRPFTVFYEDGDLFCGLQRAVQLWDSGRYNPLREQYRQMQRASFAAAQRHYLED